MLACYTDRLSARAGEAFALHAVTSGESCTANLQIRRIGKSEELVFEHEVRVPNGSVPDHADQQGCDWPVVARVNTAGDWKSGYYAIRLRAGAVETEHFIVVMPRRNDARARFAFILATNTYHAYNYWGGANAYADVAALMSGSADLAKAMGGSISRLSTRRPFAPMIVAAPADVPRLVNMRPRDFGEQPWAADPSWMMQNRSTPYDGSAGFLNKWEHKFAIWAEEAGYTLDYFTDADIEKPGALDGYACAVIVGHSEYWSGPQRDTIERFVDDGGNLAIFSGNTAFWKVRHEDGALFCPKWSGFELEPQADAKTGCHLWSHPRLARPEASITGLSFLFGGYHRLGMCVSRGSGGYTIYDPDHWALKGTDLYYGDVLGASLPLIGYESDGCWLSFAPDGRLQPRPHLGVPEQFQVIGAAPAAFGEVANSPYPPIIPPERLDVCSEIVFGKSDPQTQAAMLRGHTVFGSFARGKGEVFNSGTTEWAHALAAGDPYVDRITRNVLEKFAQSSSG